MTYLESAIRLATEGHAGQVDKVGQPYILHPLRVMHRVQRHGHVYAAAAVLHDVFEDTALRPCDFVVASIPAEVTEVVLRLTRSKEQRYFDYVQALADHAVARTVKIADLLDNLDPVRAAGLPEGERRGLEKRHTKALRLLLDKEREATYIQPTKGGSR